MISVTEEYSYSHKPSICPVCGSRQVANIIYGLVNFTPTLSKEIEKGKIVLGGCIKLKDAPLWECPRCKTQFFRGDLEAFTEIRKDPLPENITDINTPLGVFEITYNSEIIRTRFIDGETPDEAYFYPPYANIQKADEQLHEYFEGKRKKFDLHIKLRGSYFEIKVWERILKIPYGETISYSQIAKEIGFPNAARAVGLVAKKNRLPIIVPCHRVIGKNGNLVGYTGGLWRKKWLLQHESRHK